MLNKYLLTGSREPGWALVADALLRAKPQPRAARWPLLGWGKGWGAGSADPPVRGNAAPSSCVPPASSSPAKSVVLRVCVHPSCPRHHRPLQGRHPCRTCHTPRRRPLCVLTHSVVPGPLGGRYHCCPGSADKESDPRECKELATAIRAARPVSPAENLFL